jgi:hypothetical protein
LIYQLSTPDLSLDQGDIIDGCPILRIGQFDQENPDSPQVACSTHRVVVLTQTCDLANQRTQHITVAIVHDAQFLVEQGIVRAADVRGPVRAGRVYGWYFLPSCPECELSESIIDLRQLHTIPREVLDLLCATGRRRARIQPLYREHLAKHFADTFSRIGLPEPYDTE